MSEFEKISNRQHYSCTPQLFCLWTVNGHKNNCEKCQFFTQKVVLYIWFVYLHTQTQFKYQKWIFLHLKSFLWHFNLVSCTQESCKTAGGHLSYILLINRMWIFLAKFWFKPLCCGLLCLCFYNMYFQVYIYIMFS